MAFVEAGVILFNLRNPFGSGSMPFSKRFSSGRSQRSYTLTMPLHLEKIRQPDTAPRRMGKACFENHSFCFRRWLHWAGFWDWGEILQPLQAVRLETPFPFVKARPIHSAAPASFADIFQRFRHFQYA